MDIHVLNNVRKSSFTQPCNVNTFTPAKHLERSMVKSLLQ